MRFVFPLALALTLVGGAAAQACDQHGADYGPMSAYFHYRDMSETERRAADVAARDAMREKDILEARSMLMSRFQIKVDASPDETQVADNSSTRRQRR
ncbi:MAG TPA: hypothetical protein PKB04_03780 [Phenylobacterium sp.]|nr:hypothetical protein [Phenylobacterium sp.]